MITRNDHTFQGPIMTTDKRAIYSGTQIYQDFDSLTLPDATVHEYTRVLMRPEHVTNTHTSARALFLSSSWATGRIDRRRSGEDYPGRGRVASRRITSRAIPDPAAFS